MYHPTHIKMGPLLLLALLLLSSSLMSAAGFPAQAADSRYFAETGHTVQAQFLAYWQAHGGLAQQGYPLSEEVTAVSPTDGKPYTMQYFERAVFERHPENAPPAAVQLSLLGVFAYAQRYGPAGAANQHVASDNARFFPQTGHSLGGLFRAYWEGHGDLAQQGYPISDEFSETSALDGKPYTVQYFQRAVFERHPEQAGTPYEVLLSQLGRLRYTAQTAPTATVTTPAGLPGERLPVPGDVQLGGHYLVYTRGSAPNMGIFAYNLLTRQEQAVKTGIAALGALTFSPQGNALVWSETAEGRVRLRGYYLDRRQEFIIIDTPVGSSLDESGLSLDGEDLYYTDFQANHNGIFRRNLQGGPETRFGSVSPGTPNPSQGQIVAGRFVWKQQIPDGVRLNLYDLPAAHNTVITETRSADIIHLSADYVVWHSYANPDHPQVVLYSIATGRSQTLAADSFGPVIGGHWAVISRQPSFGPPQVGYSLVLYDLATGQAQVLPVQDRQRVWGVALTDHALLYTGERDPGLYYLPLP